MTLIEGIGDEVIQFFVLLAIILIALIAWWSTNISERPLMRTVLILERRTTRHNPDGQTPLGDTSDLPQQDNQPEAECKTSQSESDGTNSPVEVNVSESFDNVFVNREEEESSVADAEQILKVESTENPEIQHPFTCSQSDETLINNEKVGVINNKNEVIKNSEKNCSQIMAHKSSTSGEFGPDFSNEGNIRIRLKYLNDDQKLVEGKLQEQLGDFKRRHFNLELSGRKLVRLIFNGKVLQQDSETLQNYGFFDNCVVHCLVHQPRTPPPSPNLNRTQESQVQNEGTSHHWDLGNILFASLSFLLGLAWYGRYQYAQLYTATTTVALIGLTGMFTVTLLGMYMPDVDGIRT